MMFAITVFLLCSALVAPALAIEESEVESAIAASSREEVAGNIFIWFLCAIAFLKVSQKIDSFMSALGINVGRTGGSMLGELMIAGRAIGAAAGAAGGAISNIFNQNHSRSNTTNQAAGQAFPGHGGGLVSVAKRAAGNAAASSATGRSSGIGSFVGGAMFGSSMRGNGRLAQDVVSAVATGNFSSVGSITGEKASQALCNYLGYTAGGEQGAGIETEPLKAAGQAGSVTLVKIISRKMVELPPVLLPSPQIVLSPARSLNTKAFLQELALLHPMQASISLALHHLSAMWRLEAGVLLDMKLRQMVVLSNNLRCITPNSTWSRPVPMKLCKRLMEKVGTSSTRSLLFRGLHIRMPLTTGRSSTMKNRTAASSSSKEKG